MGFCGCSLYASVITAGVLSMIDCLIYITIDILIIITLSGEKALRSDSHHGNDLFYGFYHHEDRTMILVILSVRVGIRAIWLLTTIPLFQGNGKEYRKFLYAWEMTAIIRIVLSVAMSIFACVKYMSHMNDVGTAFHEWTNGKIETETGSDEVVKKAVKTVVEFFFLFDLLEVPTLSFIWWILLIVMIIFVHQRGVEINERKSGSMAQRLGASNGNQANGNLNYNNHQAKNYEQIHRLNASTLEQERNPTVQFNNTSLKLPRTTYIPPTKSNDENVNGHQTEDVMDFPRTGTNDPNLKLNIKLDDAKLVNIPRARSKTPPKDYDVKANIASFESKVAVDAVKRRESQRSNLARRTSYLYANDVMRREDLQRSRQIVNNNNNTRNPANRNSYYGQSAANYSFNPLKNRMVDNNNRQIAYENRAFEGTRSDMDVSNPNNDYYRPVSIKRAKLNSQNREIVA